MSQMAHKIIMVYGIILTLKGDFYFEEKDFQRVLNNTNSNNTNQFPN